MRVCILSEENLKANYVTTVCKGSSRCSPQSLVASHIPRFFRIRRTRNLPGGQKSWRKGKTSGDATRKCSKGETVTFNNSWRGQQGPSEGLAFKDHKGRVLQRTQTLNLDTATVQSQCRAPPLHQAHKAKEGFCLWLDMDVVCRVRWWRAESCFTTVCSSVHSWCLHCYHSNP